MIRNKPALGTTAHYHSIGITEDRLIAMRLPSRVGDKLVYPPAYYEHQQHMANLGKKTQSQQSQKTNKQTPSTLDLIAE